MNYYLITYDVEDIKNTNVIVYGTNTENAIHNFYEYFEKEDHVMSLTIKYIADGAVYVPTTMVDTIVDENNY